MSCKKNFSGSEPKLLSFLFHIDNITSLGLLVQLLPLSHPGPKSGPAVFSITTRRPIARHEARRVSNPPLLSCVRCITMLRNFRALRKFSGGPWLSKKRDLLAPRRQERQVRKFNFFAAFAPLREIFRVLVAAPPRCVLCGRGFLTLCSAYYYS